MKRSRGTISPELKLKAAQLVVDQQYSIRKACETMGVSKSSMENWVRQLRLDKQGKTPKASAMTPDQCRIQELEKHLRQVETEKEIL
ncbi:MAG: hypothetical protein B6D77_04820 [gamma proteobacterium symbiont of Ctena orbiculata]|nr:MAG: hypothetical protein B6D77_04820 [gamma proteobacterium symbiont of Ctena orbiculata]PVV17560.1 MAG: hypothetical protein B6D78_18470 [gamma proteobacterium symbiont of Ctena orbiculata]PVV27130.1 MAG: hypothetical protein B6D79_04030 [gamma proteobacterium symbiont of Ctena orbiculata]